MERTIYFCEDVSSIEFRDGLFFLTDHSGDTTITRAMRPSTFFRCVAGAMRVIDEFEKRDCAVVGVLGRH